MRRMAVAVMAFLAFATTGHSDRAANRTAGKEIYLRGQSPSGAEITASVGGDPTPVPGALLPCANCHGLDGRGRPEGGIAPSNITWTELTKPYRTETVNGRRRPPYSEAALERAITRGIDSANHPLHGAMPRYTMRASDMASLISYLKIVGHETEPGVTGTSIRLATIVPRSGPGAAAGRQISAVLAACFADAGKVHGRSIELTPVELAESGSWTEKALEHAIAVVRPFALVGGLVSGVETPVEHVVEGDEVPLVLPITSHGDNSAANRQRYYFYPGVEAQMRGLLRFETQRRGSAPAHLVIVAGGETMAAARRGAEGYGGADQTIVIDSQRSDAVDLLARQRQVADVIALLDPKLRLSALALADSRATLFFFGDFLPQDFFTAAAGLEHAIVALAMSPADLPPEGLAEFRAFAEKHGIDRSHFAAQISAYAAAKVVIHALKKSGRELSRESFRNAMESMYQFETGVTPPLSFARTRRIGSTRVDVATIDPTTKRLQPIGRLPIEP